MTAVPFLRTRATSIRLRRPAFLRVAFGASMAVAGVVVAMPKQLEAQSFAGSAWSLPDANELLTRVIRRIVTQDKPGGLPIAGYGDRAFGREETVAAVRAFATHVDVLAPSIFADVSSWPEAHAIDTLPCAVTVVPVSVLDSVSSRCRVTNALFLAVTRIERGPLPHELHVWYVTRFRTDVQGSVQSATYSFCERWLRIGGVWKYDGFVRMARGVVTSATKR